MSGQRSPEKINRETSIKDFPSVLERFILDIPYSKEELEFEFALPWADLKPLLDKFCQYTTEADGKIKMLSKTPRLSDIQIPPLTAKQLGELINMFYRGNAYRSISLNKFNPTPEQIKLLDAGRAVGLVIRTSNHLSLHSYIRKV